MSAGPNHFVARQVRDLVERQQLDAMPDRTLLARFLTVRDEGAFAALVRRHGPMVLGACRRVLRNTQDAEDACQAVFLVLARKGAAVRGDNGLAGWLHRVAVRAALRLRRQLARRETEPLPPEVIQPTAGDELVWREVRGAFDAEVGRLPERLRLPLVLCYLQGKTRAQAARELGWSEGAVRGRLERGRKALQSRFARKGLTLPAALLPLLVEQAAPATTPPAAVAPASIAARLADAVVRSMAVAKVKAAGWATAAVLLVGSAVGLGVYHPAGAEPGAWSPPPAKTPDPPPAAVDADKNLDTFVLRVSLAPKGEDKRDPKYSLYHVLLYVPNLRLEPPAKGPDGNPVEAHARIPKEQAKKVLEALRDHGFFEGPRPAATPRTGFGPPSPGSGFGPGTPGWPVDGRWVPPPVDRAGPHAVFALRYQGGEDPTRREVAYPWDRHMLLALDAVRAAVDGEAAKALDRLIAQLAEERSRWDPTAGELTKLQGTWVLDPADNLNRDGLTAFTAKCAIDGKRITFKPTVQLDPLLDLETIQGTFELAAADGRRTMQVTGTRDTVSKVDRGTWYLRYQVTDTTLTILLPPMNAVPPDGMTPDPKKGERLFVLKRAAAGLASDWGEPANGLRTRIRTSKAKWAPGESPAFDLDVSCAAAGYGRADPAWQAPRVGQLARVEVDGVWYTSPDPLKKVVLRPLKFGETVERWATVALTDDSWTAEYFTGIPADHVGRRLALKPGKHKVRVAYRFSRGDKDSAAAEPASGLLEFEVLPPPLPKGGGKGPAVQPPVWRSSAAWVPHGPNGVRALAVTPDGKRLYTVGTKGVTLWDLTGPEPKAEQKVEYTVGGMEFVGLDRDGLPLFVRRVMRDELRPRRLELTVMRLSDMDDVKRPPTASVDPDTVSYLTVNPDGRTLAVVGGAKWDAVRLFDVESRTERTLDAPKLADKSYAFPRGLRFSPDGKHLVGVGGTDYPVTGHVNGGVICWDAETGKVLWLADEQWGQSSVAFSLDGKSLATGSLHGGAALWDAATGTKQATVRADWPEAVALSPDGRTLVTGSHTSDGPRKALVEVWDLATPAKRAYSVTGTVQHIRFGPDGRSFATADTTGEVRWWVAE